MLGWPLLKLARADALLPRDDARPAPPTAAGAPRARPDGNGQDRRAVDERGIVVLSKDGDAASATAVAP